MQRQCNAAGCVVLTLTLTLTLRRADVVFAWPFVKVAVAGSGEQAPDRIGLNLIEWQENAGLTDEGRESGVSQAVAIDVFKDLLDMPL